MKLQTFFEKYGTTKFILSHNNIFTIDYQYVLVITRLYIMIVFCDEFTKADIHDIEWFDSPDYKQYIRTKIKYVRNI